MTLLIRTESHGTVEGGFFASFSSFFRVAEYAFVTKHVCEVLTDFAKNPGQLEGKLIAYDLENFSRAFTNHLSSIVQGIGQRGFDPPTLKEIFAKKQGEVSVADDVNLYRRGKKVKVRIPTPEMDKVSIGEYVLSAKEFGGVARYVCRGGFFGWYGDDPAFAKEAFQAIRRSEHPIYRELKLALQKEGQRRN